MYGAVPPVTVAVAFPLQPFVAFVFVTETIKELVSLIIVTEAVSERLLESVTITVYAPAHNESTYAEVPPLDHEKVYGAAPPVAEAVDVPLHPLVAFVFDTVTVSCAEALPHHNIKAVKEISCKIFFMFVFFNCILFF